MSVLTKSGFMKVVPLFLASSLFFLIACQKEKATGSVSDVPAGEKEMLSSNANAKGGGGNTAAGLMQSVLSGTASRLIAGKTDSILVSFTQPAPAGGWTITLSSSNPAAAQVPATYLVPAGVSVVHPPVTGGNLSDATTATLSVRLNAETRSTTIKVFPLTANFPAPQLQSPGNGAGFKPRTIVTFQWNANNNAYYHHLQIASNPAFNSPETNLYLDDPIWPQSTFGGFTNYWRVRYISADGTAGPWSATRTFTIKP